MRKRENGFTLVEILIALSIVAILILAVAGILGVLPRFYLEVREQDESQEMAWTALNFMAQELRSARGFHNIDSTATRLVFRDESGQQITYRHNAGRNWLERQVGTGAWAPMIDNVEAAEWGIGYSGAGSTDPARFSQVTLNLRGESVTVRPRMFRGEDDGGGWWR